jgi:hypothetical protein
MIMRELAAAALFTPEQEATADELVPGWRDMEPVEFQHRAAAAAESVLAEGAVIERYIRDLEAGS